MSFESNKKYQQFPFFNRFYFLDYKKCEKCGLSWVTSVENLQTQTWPILNFSPKKKKKEYHQPLISQHSTVFRYFLLWELGSIARVASQSQFTSQTLDFVQPKIIIPTRSYEPPYCPKRTKDYRLSWIEEKLWVRGWLRSVKFTC